MQFVYKKLDRNPQGCGGKLLFYWLIDKVGRGKMLICWFAVW